MNNSGHIAKQLQRDAIRQIVPYKANKQNYKIKLDANESPFSLSEGVRKKVSEYLLSDGKLNLYPDSDSDILRKKLAIKSNANPENILVGAGSDQIIELIIKAFVDKGERVVMPIPSFSMYKLDTLVYGGQPVEVSLDKEYRYDLDFFISSIKKYSPKVAFICNPNNPTGTVIERKDLITILQECKDTIIAVDEAYYEYFGETIADKVNDFDNLVVLRTFSKAYGLAGLRIGYCIGHKSIIEVLNKAKPPYNLSSLAQIVASLILDEEQANKEKIKNILEQREYLYNELKKLKGIKVFESKANFILFKTDKEIELDGFLQHKGILVRSFKGSALLDNCYRVTVGTKDQNQEFLQVIKDII
ncbi:MAG: histidinol-phosphate transaminase [Clostridia bacterium]|nr:histidinol-phosphate transaminase [Clostridia bacterium]